MRPSTTLLRELRQSGMSENEAADYLHKLSKGGDPTSPQAQPTSQVMGSNLEGPYKDHADLRQQARLELERRGWECWATAQGSKGNGRIYHTKGTPDDFACKAGRIVFFEAKTPGTGLSDAQIKEHTRLRKCGMEVYTYYTVGELLHQMGENEAR